MQLFEYRSVRYWSKEINGTRTGGGKTKFFHSRPRAPYGLWRPRRFNPVNPCPRGLPGVAWGRVVAYAACADSWGPPRLWKPCQEVIRGLVGRSDERLVDYAPSPGACAVSDCTRLITDPNNSRETSWAGIDRIKPARPPSPWRCHRPRIKKFPFSAPSTCPIDLFGPLANGTILKRLHTRSSLLASVLHTASCRAAALRF